MTEGVRCLLDTSAILVHWRQETGWEDVQALLESEDGEFLVASLTLTEFGRRMRALGASEKLVNVTLAEYELVLAEIVPIDAGIARAALKIGGLTHLRLPLADALIAAAAHSRDAVLVHCDAHMRAIPTDVVQSRELGSTATPT